MSTQIVQAKVEKFSVSKGSSLLVADCKCSRSLRLVCPAQLRDVIGELTGFTPALRSREQLLVCE